MDYKGWCATLLSFVYANLILLHYGYAQIMKLDTEENGVVIFRTAICCPCIRILITNLSICDAGFSEMIYKSFNYFFYLHSSFD